MSTEIRSFRPFRGLEKAEELAASLRLVVNDTRLEPGQRLQLPVQEFLTASVAVEVAEDGAGASPADRLRSAAAAAGVAEQNLGLVVIAKSARLKLADIVETWDVTNVAVLSEGFKIASPVERPAALQAPFGGCSIEAYVCLLAEEPKAVLRPWRAGTWLGSASFRLETTAGSVGFTPLPLDDPRREQLGLDKQVMRFAEIEEVGLVGDAGDDVIKLWVDAELLSMLALYPRLPASRALQRQLFIDAMQSIIVVASTSQEVRQASASDIEDTLLGRFLEWLAGVGAGSSEQDRLQARADGLQRLSSGPLHMMTAVEARVGKALKKDLLEAITGGVS